jgi:hypothetical protein
MNGCRLAFSIAFLDESVIYEEDGPTASGRLLIGDWEEIFVSSLFFWRKEDYEAQWLNAIRLLLSGKDKATLIVEHLGPEAGRLRWWPIYRVENTIYFREQILFFDKLKQPFSLENAFLFVEDRRTTNEDGHVISEWDVSLSEVRDFANALSH